MDEERITTLTNLLLDKDESEIEQTFEALGVSDEKREEIRKRLSELRFPPKGVTPEKPRKNEHFREPIPLTLM